MNRVSNVSAPTPDYQLACEELELDPKEPRLMSAGGDGVLLNPWQVIGVAWGLGQEAGPCCGGIIADACGIGKTIEALGIVAQAIFMRKQWLE